MSVLSISCPILGCGFETGEVPESVAVLNMHALIHAPARIHTDTERHNGPKLDRPRVQMGISTEEWNMFNRRWNVFKGGSKIDDAMAAPHLFQCASDDLGDALLKIDAHIISKPIDYILDAMKNLAVIPVAMGVVRAELLNMKQKRDEPVRTFCSHIHGKAQTFGSLTTSSCKCSATNNVNYTDNVIN